MAKYPISKEFFPFSHFTPPIGRSFLRLAKRFMKTPSFLWRDPQLTVEKKQIPGYRDEPIETLILSPKELDSPAPCLIYYHGGGFVLNAANYHYRLAMDYAKKAGCKVVFVQYRLALDDPFPTPVEDSYAALCLVYEQADVLGIDRTRIALGGDSAGAQLTASVTLLARDRAHPIRPIGQMLVYPYLDDRCNSESAQKYTDTPMWNSSLSKRVGPINNPGRAVTDKRMISPAEVENLNGLPQAYIETAEFDCLHDDGILYAERLRGCGISVTLNETKGTMHGFDIVLNCETTQAAVRRRIEFLRQIFHTA